MDRVYNFNAGPSAMPLEVLQEARAEFLNYKNTGMSIIEMSHRSPEYAAMHAETKALLRQLMEIPKDYEILFIQGGGSLQFLMTAANFFTNKRAAYANTGVWAKKPWQKPNALAKPTKPAQAQIKTTAIFRRSLQLSQIPPTCT